MEPGQVATKDGRVLKVGDRVVIEGYENTTGIIRFAGLGVHAKAAGKKRVGVELELPCGKNDGTVGGHSYFTCPSNHGVLIAKLEKLTVVEAGGDIKIKQNPLFDDGGDPGPASGATGGDLLDAEMYEMPNTSSVASAGTGDKPSTAGDGLSAETIAGFQGESDELTAGDMYLAPEMSQVKKDELTAGDMYLAPEMSQVKKDELTAGDMYLAPEMSQVRKDELTADDMYLKPEVGREVNATSESSLTGGNVARASEIESRAHAAEAKSLAPKTTGGLKFEGVESTADELYEAPQLGVPGGRTTKSSLTDDEMYKIPSSQPQEQFNGFNDADSECSEENYQVPELNLRSVKNRDEKLGQSIQQQSHGVSDAIGNSTALPQGDLTKSDGIVAECEFSPEIDESAQVVGADTASDGTDGVSPNTVATADSNASTPPPSTKSTPTISLPQKPAVAHKSALEIIRERKREKREKEEALEKRASEEVQAQKRVSMIGQRMAAIEALAAEHHKSPGVKHEGGAQSPAIPSTKRTLKDLVRQSMSAQRVVKKWPKVGLKLPTEPQPKPTGPSPEELQKAKEADKKAEEAAKKAAAERAERELHMRKAMELGEDGFREWKQARAAEREKEQAERALLEEQARKSQVRSQAMQRVAQKGEDLLASRRTVDNSL